MYKKLLVASSILIIAILSFSVCFANNGLQDAANGVKNVVGNAENTVENTAKDISNTSKNVTEDVEKGANNLGNTVKNDVNNTTTGTTTNNYTATRTATQANTFMGMNSTAWTWLIIGIATIAIVALVWYYSMQIRSSNYNGRD